MANKANVASKSNARANAVSVSWENDKTREARSKRDAVTVALFSKGKFGKAALYGSVRKAFDAYRLPSSKHQDFRLALKKEGMKVFDYNGMKLEFRIVGAATEKVEVFRRGDSLTHPKHGIGRYLGIRIFTDMKIASVDFKGKEVDVKVADLKRAPAKNVVNAVTTEVSKKNAFVFPTAESMKDASRIQEGMRVARRENPGYPVGFVGKVAGGFARVDHAEGSLTLSVIHLVECTMPVPPQLACDFTKSLPFSSLPLLAAFKTVTSEGFDFRNSYIKVGNSTAIRVSEVSVQGGALYAKLESPSPVDKARFKKDYPVFPLYVKAAQ